MASTLAALLQQGAQAVQAAGNGGGVASLATPSALAALIPAQPRKRAAVVAHDAFVALDVYSSLQPAIFAAALAGAASAAALGWKRRHKGAEAWALWGAAALGLTVVAWVTKPFTLGGAVAAASGQAPAGPGALGATNAWLDARAASLDKSSPGWDGTALKRLLGG